MKFDNCEKDTHKSYDLDKHCGLRFKAPKTGFYQITAELPEDCMIAFHKYKLIHREIIKYPWYQFWKKDIIRETYKYDGEIPHASKRQGK